jgi:hypothetical protein
MCEINDKNRIKEHFISLHAFHRTPDKRVQKITVGEQFKPQNLESFDLVTQELYRLLSAMSHTPHEQKSMNTSEKNQSHGEHTLSALDSAESQPFQCGKQKAE